MSPQPESLYASLAAAARLVRRRAALTLLVAALCALPAALLVAWALGARWLRPTPVPLIVDLFLLAVGAGVALYWMRRVRPRIDEARVAAAAEQRLGLSEGSLRGVLELRDRVPDGTSATLARRAERSMATRLAGERPHDLAGDLGDGWSRRARRVGIGLGVAVFGLGMLAFTSPERTRAGWAPLLHPVRQLRAPALPALAVEPGDAEVLRGEPLAVSVGAVGREAVVLHWRLEGDVAREQLLPVRAERAQGAIPAVSASGEYWVEAPDGAVSARFRLTPVDALLLSSVEIDVLYPEYLGLQPEHYEGEIPLLELPAGTSLRIAGRATRPLRAAVLQGERGEVRFTPEQRAFSGRWAPRESGVYSWDLRDEGGASLAVAPPPLEVVITPDQAPTVELTFPGSDTLFAADLQQTLAADARDDHGLTAAMLVSWRVSSTGQRDATVETPIGIEQAGDRALLRSVLDASARGLVPGDTLKYFVRVTDNSPARQTGVSGTYALRLPSAEELRARAEQDARAALDQAEQLQKQVTELQRETRNAERNTQASNARRSSRSSGSGGAPGTQSAPRMQFEETQEARRVLEKQQSMMQQAEQLRGAMDALEKSATDAGLRDQELQRKLEELRELYDKLLTPELRRQMEALQKAVQQLSPEEMEKALERLAEQQKQMAEQLDRSLELLKRAAAEQEMNALAQQAKELSTQQDALAKEHEQAKSEEEQEKRAQQQETLAQKGEELSKEMEQLGKELRRQGESQAAEKTEGAAEQAKSAQEQMAQSAQSASERRNRDAAQEGRKAAEELREAAESLESARQEMASQGKQEAQESAQQATRDALELAQRQQQLQQQMIQAGKQQQQQQQGGEGQQAQPPQAQNRPGSGQQQGQPGQQGQQKSQQPGNQQGGQRSEQGGGEKQGGRQPGGQQGGQQSGGTAGESGADLSQMRAEQRALQQGLEQLGKNVSETAQRSGMISQDVGAALNRANTAMQQTAQGLEQAQQSGQLPAEQAGQSVDALNRLALSLLHNAQQIQQAAGGGGAQQAMQQLADLAQQQGSVNGQSSSLQPLGLSQNSMSEQARRLGQAQQQIAQQLGGMSNLLGGREDVMGELDALAKEADALARQLQGGRLPPEVLARQERLFHRLLDAGRTLEQEETSDERTAERPGEVSTRAPGALDPRLLDSSTRFRVPTPEELRALPPAYRRLILDYFERLNRAAPGSGR